VVATKNLRQLYSIMQKEYLLVLALILLVTWFISKNWIIIGIIAFVYLILTERRLEYFGSWKTPLTYDYYTPNQNAFRNFYRVGYELSEKIGWKPTDTWNHLQPQNNDCPQCFQEEDN